MIYALTAFSLLCLACAIGFAIDWHRMKRQRDNYRSQAHQRAWWQDFAAPHLDAQPRDERGRFAKRQG